MRTRLSILLSFAFLLMNSLVFGNSLVLTHNLKVIPNPFSPNTETAKITFALSQPASIKAYIFDLSGEMIFERDYSSGSLEVQNGQFFWNGRTDVGDQVANGVYLVYLTDGNRRLLGRSKILVVK